MGLYKLLGAILTLIGLALILFSFYFGLNPIAFNAGGLSTIILGFTCICLAYTSPRIPLETAHLFLNAEVENTTVILEALEIKNKAVYFPHQAMEENPQSLIPLSEDLDIKKVSDKLHIGSLIKLMPNSDIPAVAVTTPGNISLSLYRSRPGGSAAELESALKYLLTRELSLASGIRVNLRDSQIIVEVRRASILFEDNLYFRSVGSPIASITAAISSEALEKPVRIVEERNHQRNIRISLEVLA